MKLISVIVPVYNVELYLERCVRSILQQTYPHFEVLLINDGSKDQSLAVANALAQEDARVKVFTKANGGLGSARNFGLQQACGEVVCFIDSDDWIVEDYFSYAMNLMEQNQAQIVSCSYYFTSGTCVLPNQTIEEQVMSKKEALRYYAWIGIAQSRNDYSACTKLYQKALFDEIQFPVNQLFEDMATNFALIQACTTYVKSSRYVYYYFENPSSITRSGFKKRDQDFLKVCNQMVDLAKNEQDPTLQKLVEIKAKSAYFSMLVKMARYGIDPELTDGKALIKAYTKELRHSYFDLMKSDFSLSRKVVMTLLCIHFEVLHLPLSFKR